MNGQAGTVAVFEAYNSDEGYKCSGSLQPKGGDSRGPVAVYANPAKNFPGIF